MAGKGRKDDKPHTEGQGMVSRAVRDSTPVNTAVYYNKGPQQPAPGPNMRHTNSDDYFTSKAERDKYLNKAKARVRAHATAEARAKKQGR